MCLMVICGSVWGYLSSLPYPSDRLLVVIWLLSIVVQSLPVFAAVQFRLVLMPSCMYRHLSSSSCTLPSLSFSPLAWCANLGRSFWFKVIWLSTVVP